MIKKNIAGDIASVFVYGTLMPNSKNAHIAQQAGKHHAEKAYIEGMHLYDLKPEGYPGIVYKKNSHRENSHKKNSIFGTNPQDENPTGRVDGYVLHFADITLALTLLDEFEGCYLEPPDYHRETITVQPHGRVAWVYVYADNERLTRPGATLVRTGKWYDNG